MTTTNFTARDTSGTIMVPYGESVSLTNRGTGCLRVNGTVVGPGDTFYAPRPVIVTYEPVQGTRATSSNTGDHP